MSAILYNYLPTELVYTIYEYLHRICMLEVCKEMDEIQSILYDYNMPFLCRIGECDCEGDCGSEFFVARETLVVIKGLSLPYFDRVSLYF